MARDLTTGYGGRPHSGNAPPLAGYRFGCGQASLGHERSALDRATGFLKNLAEAITMRSCVGCGASSNSTAFISISRTRHGSQARCVTMVATDRRAVAWLLCCGP